MNIAQLLTQLLQTPKHQNNHTAQVQQLRQLCLEHYPQLATIPNHQGDTWWLFGTTGCHLCEQAEQLLQQLQSVADIEYQVLDITDFNEEILDTLGEFIPVIITPNYILHYPFSIMDLYELI